jgi:hypothetical protein
MKKILSASPAALGIQRYLSRIAKTAPGAERAHHDNPAGWQDLYQFMAFQVQSSSVCCHTNRSGSVAN